MATGIAMSKYTTSAEPTIFIMVTKHKTCCDMCFPIDVGRSLVYLYINLS